jgi:hypothetical protein
MFELITGLICYIPNSSMAPLLIFSHVWRPTINSQILIYGEKFNSTIKLDILETKLESIDY